VQEEARGQKPAAELGKEALLSVGQHLIAQNDPLVLADIALDFVSQSGTEREY